MKNQTNTIKRIINELNTQFWLPSVQRNFVWKEEQIERLFDSLMRDYPIGTLLVWKTNTEINHRKFIDNYKMGMKFKNFYNTTNKQSKIIVLDGQQRLQSLFIGLKGSYNGKELYFDILSGENVLPEDIKYTFKFYKEKPKNEYIKLKDLVYSNNTSYVLAQEIIGSLTDLKDNDKNKIHENIATISTVFREAERIVYQELDSIDNPKIYSEDDVVEIFIRANSGGTPLGKSDLLFSLLVSSWDEAEEKIEDLLEDINKEGYAFNRDFILKTCLTLLETGASYKVQKFRNKEMLEQMKSNWSEIEKSIKDVKDFLYGKTYLRSKKALKSYLTLIPIIYFRYKYPEKWKNIKNLDNYILKTLLAGSFGGSPDALIDSCNREIKDRKDFQVSKIFNVIRSNGRNLEISENELLGQNYGRNNELHLIFNLWYRDYEHNPSYYGNELQIDHIFPTALLKDVKENGRMKYNKEYRDKIGNLMLLTREENGSGGKGDMAPEDWFKNKDPRYMKRHLIPDNTNLWKVENFEGFIKEREKLISNHFKKTLHLVLTKRREK